MQKNFSMTENQIALLNTRTAQTSIIVMTQYRIARFAYIRKLAQMYNIHLPRWIYVIYKGDLYQLHTFLKWVEIYYDIQVWEDGILSSNIREMDWISIHERKPKPLQKVYVVCEIKKNGNIYYIQTIAEYIPYMTIPEEDFIALEHRGTESDYKKNEDQYYAHEGFYESQIEPPYKYRITEKITHWRPLLPLP